ncbi:hypothetical protein BHE74_00010732 [Ensete ventricosum]|nr:hypothetical protein BHE74_00010732 [Ensete ventricosum]
MMLLIRFPNSGDIVKSDDYTSLERHALELDDFALGGRSYIPVFQIRVEKMKGGQASASLAVSTRWISTAKLLLSDLATLAQREGGE